MNLINLNGTSYGKDGLFVAFKNGSVGILNYHKKKLEYLSQPNHSETIFDVMFKPSNKNIVATGSYDGIIKIWNSDGMECIINIAKPTQQIQIHTRTFASFQKNVIYGICWHPTEDKIASVNANGEVLIWNTEKGRLLADLTPGTNSSIHRVDWNPLSPHLIATGSSDNYA